MSEILTPIAFVRKRGVPSKALEGLAKVLDIEPVMVRYSKDGRRLNYFRRQDLERIMEILEEVREKYGKNDGDPQ